MLSVPENDDEILPSAKKSVKKLKEFCCDIVAEFSDNQLRWYVERYMETVDDVRKEKILNSTSSKYLSFPLNLSLLLFTQEKYWQKRCCSRSWTLVHYWFYFCNWKSTYVSRYAEELIDWFICGELSFSALEDHLLLFRDHLYTLKMNGYKLKYINSNFKKFTANNGNMLLEDYILQIISMFPLLKELYLNNIPMNYELALNLDDNCFADQSIERLSTILSTLETLQKVSLIGTHIKSLQFCEILRSLRPLKNLVELNLSCNLISDDLCEDIANLLSGSKIQKLVLTNNDIGNVGAKHLARILSSHDRIKSLFLDQNVIEDEGATFIAESILNSSSVVKLDISHNKITGNAAEIFCKLLQENVSLEYLNLVGNLLGAEAGAKICSAVKLNKNLGFFGYLFCGFTKCDEDVISLHITKNYTEAAPQDE